MKSQWSYVVINEAHKVKNLPAQVTEALDTVECNKKNSNDRNARDKEPIGTALQHPHAP